ncbi:MAG: glycosyltransferase family 2 protein, partial [Magnetococcales bacterium]|nr:glycosyltransferase family 2 protein [Magnetococcales bacterium]
MIEVSVIVTFHNEKALARTTLTAIGRMRRDAADHGIVSELVAVLDCADPETRAVVLAHPELSSQARAIEVSHRDPGLSRNAGVSNAAGAILVMLDGDNYYSSNWLERSFHYIRKWGNDVILHPATKMIFGDDRYTIVRQHDQESDHYDPAGWLVHNFWDTCSAASRKIYERCPYQPTQVALTGFGYEDWHWNCETVASGYKHKVIDDAFMLYRRKKDGMCEQHNTLSAIIRPTALFQPDRAGSQLLTGRSRDTRLRRFAGAGREFARSCQAHLFTMLQVSESSLIPRLPGFLRQAMEPMVRRARALFF